MIDATSIFVGLFVGVVLAREMGLPFVAALVVFVLGWLLFIGSSHVLLQVLQP